MTGSEVTVRPVEGKREREAFVRLPFELHRGHAAWIPPFIAEDRAMMNPAKNPALGSCDVTFALAHRDGVPCGRIVGIVNRREVEARGIRAGRFGWLECPDDVEVARELLAHVESWARGLGMERLVGPMGFTDQDPEGFWIEGFEHEPTISTYSNHPFMGPLVESCGFDKEIDFVVYKAALGKAVPEFYEKVAARVRERTDYRVVEFRSRKELAPYAATIIRLMNETYADLYGYVPLDEGEIEALAKKYLPLLDPRFVLVGMKKETPIGFVVAMPNIDPGLRKARGHLSPFGVFHILRAAKRSKQLDLLLGGIRASERGRGADVLGMTVLLRRAIAAGFTSFDSHVELETNQLVRAEMERLGATVCKRYRIYGKAIAG